MQHTNECNRKTTEEEYATAIEKCGCMGEDCTRKYHGILDGWAQVGFSMDIKNLTKCDLSLGKHLDKHGHSFVGLCGAGGPAAIRRGENIVVQGLYLSLILYI